MTSRINHDQTVEFFTKNNYFGAKKEKIIFFEQAVLPVISATDGKILLEDRHKINLGPNGNGALFDSVANNQIVKDIISQSEFVQIIGVDNVLNKILDPVFIGFAISKNLQSAMKSCVKRDAKEPVGVVVKRKNLETGLSKYDIIEYSEISKEDAEAINPESGELKFNLGNILVFLLSSKKLLELVNNASTLNDLYHKAFKKYAYIDTETLKKIVPTVPNAYKFELFIHNFLPMCEAGRFGVLRVPREEEFAPVKNAEGVDSPQSARELIYAQSIRWLQRAGAILPDDKTVVEVDTLLSYEGEGLENWKNLSINQDYVRV
jgi:UDP-N-acetylglucosamine/UDP-N-acetylgalactosamine diphosphorylase